MQAVQRTPDFLTLGGMKAPACPNPEERSDEVEFGRRPPKARKSGKSRVAGPHDAACKIQASPHPAEELSYAACTTKLK